MNKIFLTLLLSLFVCSAHAGEQNLFIYNKTILRLIPKPTVETAAVDTDKKKEGADPVLGLPVLKRSPKEYKVEVREQAFLDQKDFIVHQPFSDREGMMIMVEPPADAQLNATRMIASADVLFVDQDGIIFKIAPMLDLRHLAEPIDSGKAMHAFVYLKSGTVAADDIEIGDRIENASFKTHPVVIQ